MTREHSRTVLHLCCEAIPTRAKSAHVVRGVDDRLIAAVGGAVAHFAERVGLETGACRVLTAALEDLCRQTLPLLNGNGQGLDVAIEEFDDRLQISVEHRGEEQPSVGVESFIAECARGSDRHITGLRLMRTVDRIEYDARNGSIRTTLVKYIAVGESGVR